MIEVRVLVELEHVGDLDGFAGTQCIDQQCRNYAQPEPQSKPKFE